jgi:Cu-Zn family superoxide dismutase
MNKAQSTFIPILVTALFLPVSAAAATGDEGEIEITMHQVNQDGVGKAIGTIQLTALGDGVLLTPDLKNLEPGLHGFHMHQNPSCEPAEENGKTVAAAAAGDHYNPDGGEHRGPYKEGHTGDLPSLYIGEDGEAVTPVLAPLLDYSELAGHALVIHQTGSDFLDHPDKMGEIGARLACGVIPGQ